MKQRRAIVIAALNKMLCMILDEEHFQYAPTDFFLFYSSGWIFCFDDVWQLNRSFDLTYSIGLRTNEASMKVKLVLPRHIVCIDI